MDVRILGRLEVRGQLGPLRLGGTKQRAVLAMLVLRCNRVISTDRLIAGLWADDRPVELARNAVQVYISRLRRELRTSGDEVEVHRREPGYLLEIDPQRIDLHRFEQLTQAGLGALPDTPEIAVARLTAALDLWRGSPLSEFSKEPFASVEIARLAEHHLTVLTARAEAELALGRHAELVGRLEQLLTEHPFHEGLQRQLMLSLYRSGRQTEALQAYQRMRRTFADELGIEPGRELQALEKAILNQDPQINPSRPRSMGAADTEPPIRLWVMPPRNPHFTGRNDVLTQLKVQLNQSPGTLAVQALYGLGGVGKTELAIEYAHRFAHDYEIIWWIDAGQPALIPEQLCRLAVRLGIPDRGISVETVDRVLTELATRPRWLMIFDNADRPEEIAQYRPAGTGDFLVTSRSPRWGALGGRIEVDVLDRLETITLLQRWVPRLPNNLADALATELGGSPVGGRPGRRVPRADRPFSRRLSTSVPHATRLAARRRRRPGIPQSDKHHLATFAAAASCSGPGHGLPTAIRCIPCAGTDTTNVVHRPR